VWAQVIPQTPLPRPSPEAARHLVALPIDVQSGQRLDGRGETRFDVRGAGGGTRISGAFMEYFRTDDSGRMNDTQERLTSRGFGGDDYNPFFQSWFGRPAFGPSGFGYPNQSGPFSNGAGPDIRRSPFGSIDDRPPVRRYSPTERSGF
jgi:hypothetical protein